MDKNRIIIVGATSGLGLNIANKFLEAGWSVGAAGRNESALAELERRGAITARIDITQPEADQLLNRLIERVGGMDIYFHCSGILRESDARATIATNVGGFACMVAAAYDYFVSKNPRGRLVAISSIAGTRGLAELAVYSASKAFDSTYLEALRQRADKECPSLRIVDVRPGWTRTPLLDSSKSYLLEMDESTVCCLIYKAILRARRTAVIGLRWKILCGIERWLPGWLWERMHLPLWRTKR